MNYTTPVIKKDQPDDTFKTQPLPEPIGKYPYHLLVDDILPVANPNQMDFHLVGDTGGTGNPEARQEINNQMSLQYAPGSFLYHLGDLVYHYGEASQYADQFFKPFEKYPGPIFAIAGNHDSDVNPDSKSPYQSLDAFTAVFCDNEPRHVVFSEESKRQSMTQPNIFWTLETPLATIIGLHTNVPKYGAVSAEQENWFHNELKSAPSDKMLILCLHHAPYSADINHGSSLTMIDILENAFNSTGVRPDIVFSGHVHNYQRFHQSYADGIEVPYIVSGAGGFDELHRIASLDDSRFEPLPFPGIYLKSYCDDEHGFLQISITQTGNQLQLTGKYYSVRADAPAILRDIFTVHKA